MIEGIFLLLGSNIDDKRWNLRESQKLIGRNIGKTIRESGIYQSKPWGNIKQEDFYNQVIEINFEYSCQDLLKKLLAIELVMGRTRDKKWGPRLIDLDILYFGNEIINDPELIIPHPEIQNRKFTLVPLVEIAPDFLHPVLNKSNTQILENCQDKLEVKRII